jgi:hypothetical protein
MNDQEERHALIETKRRSANQLICCSTEHWNKKTFRVIPLTFQKRKIYRLILIKKIMIK